MEVVKDIICLDGASYKNAKSFYHHIKPKHPSIVNPEYSGPRYECNLCSKIFVTQKALTNHLNRDKHAETIYMCEKCDEVFSKKSNLKRHEQIIHEEDTYSCLSCKKTFVTQQNLDRTENGKSSCWAECFGEKQEKSKGQRKKIFMVDTKHWEQVQNIKKKLYQEA